MELCKTMIYGEVNKGLLNPTVGCTSLYRHILQINVRTVKISSNDDVIIFRSVREVAHYQKWDNVDRPQYFGAGSNWEPSTEKFGGKSTFNSDFIKYNEPPRQPIKPNHTALSSDDPLADLTGYKEDYIRHPIPERSPRKADSYSAPQAPFNSSTTNKNDYTGKYAPKVASYKPDKDAFHSDAPLDDKTTFMSDYKEWPTERRMAKQRDAYEKPSGVMNNDTTHKVSYKKVPIDRAVARRPTSQTKVEGGEFNDKTNYNDDYKKFDVDRPQRFGNESTWKSPTEKFGGKSTFNSDYIQYNETPRQPIKPNRTALSSDEPLADLTGYKEEYIRHPLPERSQKQAETYTATREPFNAYTTNKNDYTGKYLPKAASCKPTTDGFHSDAPLDDKTTFLTDYKEWPIERRLGRQRDAYEKPTGVMNSDTTHKVSYKKVPIDRAVAKRPTSQTKVEGGDFNDKTIYKEDFKKFDAEPPQRFGNESEWKSPTEKFGGKSTFNSDYIKYNEAPRKPIKPDQTALSSGEPLSDRTGYKDNYVRHTIPERQNRKAETYVASVAPFNPSTTNKTDYTGKYVTKVASFKPSAQVLMSDLPIESTTTFINDYQSWPTERRHIREREAYTKPDGRIQEDTTHKVSYKKVPIDRAVAKRPTSQTKIEGGQFRDLTNYKEDFRKFEMTRTQGYGDKSKWTAPTEKFGGVSTSKRDYIGHNETPRKPLKPAHTALASDEPLDDRTGYKENYIRHTIPEKYNRQAETYVASVTPFNSSTTNKTDYTGKFVEKVAPCKPDATAFKSDDPIDTTTTFSHDYQSWPTERRHIREREVYVKSDGHIQGDTTHKLSYKRVPIDRVVAKRPTSQTKIEGGYFDDKTNYKLDFKKFDKIEKRQPFLQSEYIPNDAKFEGSSTARSEFTEHPISIRKSYKPDATAAKNDGNFEDDTTYRLSFTPKRSDRWPVDLVVGGMDGSGRAIDTNVPIAVA